MKYDADENDIENVEAWAVVVEDALFPLDKAKRLEVLKLALANEEKKPDGWVLRPFGDLSEAMSTPDMRHWNAVMQLKALLVQIFTRTVTNDNSPVNASNLLFVPHQYGTGSGALLDYLNDLIPSRSRGKK